MSELAKAISFLKKTEGNITISNGNGFVYNDTQIIRFKTNLKNFSCLISRELVEFLNISGDIGVDENKLKIKDKKNKVSVSIKEEVNSVDILELSKELDKLFTLKTDCHRLVHAAKIGIRQDQALPDFDYCYFVKGNLVFCSQDYFMTLNNTKIKEDFSIHKNCFHGVSGAEIDSISSDFKKLIQFTIGEYFVGFTSVNTTISKYVEIAIGFSQKYKTQKGVELVFSKEDYDKILKISNFSDQPGYFTLKFNDKGKITASCQKAGVFDFNCKVGRNEMLKSKSFLCSIESFLKLLEVSEKVSIIPDENVIKTSNKDIDFFIKVGE